jgi:hypothetical protein
MLPAGQTWSLAAISAASGVVLLWVWKRFSHQEHLALAKRQMRARIYAMRLYAGDPAVVLRAERQLLVWTARYLAGMLRPMGIAILPLLVLFFQLDSVYGHRALAPGESAIVTASFGGAPPQPIPEATLEGHGVVVETPAIRVSSGQLCWRIRALAGESPSLRLRTSASATEMSIRCGCLRYPSITVWHASPSIAMTCPAAALDVFGREIAWPVWFLLVSLLTMLLLRARFGVVL